MTRRSHPWLLAAAALLLLPAVGVAQRPADRQQTITPDGTEMFRWLLHARGIKPVADHEIFAFAPGPIPGDDLIVIILGTPHEVWPGTTQLSWAADALKDGGAALVASDTALNLGREFTRAPGLSVTGVSVRGTDGNTPLFQGNEACPSVVPWKKPPRGGPHWDMFAGLENVATNRPSYLHLPPGRGAFLDPIAHFPPGCWRVEDKQWLNPDFAVFAAGASGPDPDNPTPYRFLVLADPSVFINEMMLQAPDNLEFAYRVTGYLQDAGGKKRTRCLFIQNGQVVTEFDTLKSVMRPPPPPIPLPNIDQLQDKIVDAGNQIIDKLEENNAHNRLLLGNSPERQARSLRGIVSGLLFLGCLWAAVTILSRLWKARQPTDTPAAPPGGLPVSPKGDPPAGVFDRRQRELLRRNNIYEPVRVAVREMFAAAGAPADAGRKMPKVVISDMVRRSDTLRDALTELWKIGFGPARVVSVQRWSALEPLFERVRQAHADGKWRFVAAEPIG